MHLHSDQFLTGKTFKEKLGYYVAVKILEKVIALAPTHGFPVQMSTGYVIYGYNTEKSFFINVTAS